MCVQRSRSGEHDEKSNNIREGHADEGVGVNSFQLLRRLSWRTFQSFLSPVDFNLFGFLGRLPEKQIRTNRSSQHRDQRNKRFAGKSH